MADVGWEAASGEVADADGVVEGRETAGGRHPGEEDPPPFQKGQKEQGVHLHGRVVGRGSTSMVDAAGGDQGG